MQAGVKKLVLDFPSPYPYAFYFLPNDSALSIVIYPHTGQLKIVYFDEIQ